MSGTIDYVPLKIMLNTNNGDAVELKSNMFIFETDTTKTISGDGPYICTNVNYAKTVLQPLTHRERVEIFMNKDKFLDFCITSKSKKGIAPEDDKKETDEIIQNNIFIMLNAIFPTQFPLNDNVESMLPEYELNEGIFVQFTKPKYQTYLNIKKPSTVTRTVWINVMGYNPVYIKLYDLVKKYFKKMYEYYVQIFGKYPKNSLDFEFKEQNLKKNKNGKDELNSEDYINIVGVIATALKEKVLPDIENLSNKLNTPKQKTALWKLYFMLKGLVPNTQEYNTFIEKYVELFINVQDKKTIELEEELKKLEANQSKTQQQQQDITKFKEKLEANQFKTQQQQQEINNIKAKLKANQSKTEQQQQEITKIKEKLERIEQNRNRGFTTEKQKQENNESQFNSSVKAELEFHYNYIKEIVEYMPQNRQSLNDTVSELFKDNILNAQKFREAMDTKNKDYKTTVDRIKKGDSYEIQVGLSIVGGIITETTRSMSCLFDATKLAKMIKNKTNNIVGVPMYPYIDFEKQIKMINEPPPPPKKQPPPPNKNENFMPPMPPPNKGGKKGAFAKGKGGNWVASDFEGAQLFVKGTKKRRNRRRRYTRKLF